MGMFDEVRCININHKNFDSSHNNLEFQTKDLDCTLSGYCVFNGQLYQESDNSGDFVKHEKAIPVDYSDSLNIYTYHTVGKVQYWIEYDLIFENGELVDVLAQKPTVEKVFDFLEDKNRNKPSNIPTFDIDFSNCDQAYAKKMASHITDDVLAAIRQILNEPKAVINFPKLVVKGDQEFAVSRMSIVQTMDDFVNVDNTLKSATTPNGNKTHLIFDEYHAYNNGSLQKTAHCRS